MNEQLKFVELLFKDFMKNVKDHIGFKADYEKEWSQYRKGEIQYYPRDTNYMNKNHGKVALRRKITYLRQELLNLERMLDK